MKGYLGHHIFTCVNLLNLSHHLTQPDCQSHLINTKQQHACCVWDHILPFYSFLFSLKNNGEPWIQLYTSSFLQYNSYNISHPLYIPCSIMGFISSFLKTSTVHLMLYSSCFFLFSQSFFSYISYLNLKYLAVTYSRAFSLLQYKIITILNCWKSFFSFGNKTMGERK